MNGLTEKSGAEERAKYVTGFNETLMQMWQEQINLLGVVDTGALLQSLSHMPVSCDGKFLEVTLSQEFLEYGIWQDLGSGRETYIGNKGDMGRERVREVRPWFSKKYYSSVMNLRDFMAENIGKEFLGVMSEAFSAKNLRKNSNYRKSIGL